MVLPLEELASFSRSQSKAQSGSQSASGPLDCDPAGAIVIYRVSAWKLAGRAPTPGFRRPFGRVYPEQSRRAQDRRGSRPCQTFQIRTSQGGGEGTPLPNLHCISRNSGIFRSKEYSGQEHFGPNRSITYVTLSEAKSLVLCKTGSCACLKRDSSSLRSSELYVIK